MPPKKPLAEKLTAEMEKTLAANRRELESLEDNLQPWAVEYVRQLRSVIDRLETGIRNVAEKGVPAGFAEKWGIDQPRTVPKGWRLR